MSVQELLFLLVVFIAYTFEVITGFAGTLMSMPTSMMLIGVHKAKAVLNIVALAIGAIIAFSNYRHINKKELLKIVSFMSIGMLIGIVIFERLAVHYLLDIYAVFIVALALRHLLFKKAVKPKPKTFYIIIILLAGVIHGMFLSGGSLLVVYAIIAFQNKSEFRATMAAVWTVLNTVLLMNQISMGYIDNSTLTLSLYACIPLFFAILLGNYLHRYIKQTTFYMLTYILLLISGVSLLVF